MSLKRLAVAFGLVAGASALGGCAAYVTPNGNVGVGLAAPVYVEPAYRPYYAPRYYRPAPYGYHHGWR